MTGVARSQYAESFYSLVETSPFGVYLVDADFRIVEASQQARQTFESAIHPLVGADLGDAQRAIWPEPFASVTIGYHRRALETGEPYVSYDTVEKRGDRDAVEAYDWRVERIVMPDGRFGVVCYFYDQTKREQLAAALRDSEERKTFLLKLSDALRPLEDPNEIQNVAMRVLGEHLGVTRVHYHEADPNEEYLTSAGGYTNGIPPVVERVRMDDFGVYVGEAFRAGRTLAVPDVAEDKRVGRAELDSYEAIGVRAYIAVPLVKAGTLLAVLALHSATPRAWSKQDVELAEETAQRTWAAVERARAEAALRANEERLRESEKRFRHMADNAPVMIWVTDANGDCTFLSKTWCDLTGQSLETGIGPGWLDMIHPGDREMTAGRFRSDHPRREKFRVEYRLRRKDGAYIWVIDAAVPRFDESGGFLGYIGSVIDISDRKRAEDTQRLLIGELNHRVKNTLATVQSIVQLTLRHSKAPEEFAAAFTGRVQSLSRVHSVLTDGTWQGADLRELIRDQLLSGLMEERQLETSGPDVHLPPQLALHVALMLHELGTNAAKYGALSVNQGRVALDWTVRDNVLALRWNERNGPRVQAPTKRGFGSLLIEQTARGDGGAARATFHAGGVTWKIDLPLPLGPTAAPPGTAPAEMVLRQIVLADSARNGLAGRRVLVVEDEPLVAIDTAAMLSAVGIAVVGPAGNVKEALRLIDLAEFDACLLDANLYGQPVDEIAAALTRRNLPFVFVSGYGVESLPAAFAAAPLLGKPFAAEQLMKTLLDLVQASTATSRLRKV